MEDFDLHNFSEYLYVLSVDQSFQMQYDTSSENTMGKIFSINMEFG